MNTSTPTLPEVLEAAIDAALTGARTSLPGQIQSYDSTTRRATVQMLIMEAHIDADGERIVEAIAPFTDIPVALSGSGSVRIKFPIAPGDLCWLLFSSSALAVFKSTGRLSDPGDDRHHHDADVIALPVVTIGGDVESDAMIEFTDTGLIRAGGDNPLVTKAEFDSHTHPAPGGATSPPTTPATGTPRLRG